MKGQVLMNPHNFQHVVFFLAKEIINFTFKWYFIYTTRLALPGNLDDASTFKYNVVKH